jgi:dolichol-phosphate mannosyltransferase
MIKLTILIPALNEADNLPLLRDRLNNVFEGLKGRVEPEIIILDNCSVDATSDLAAAICAARPEWKYVRYSRNFGYHNSLACGFDLASGDALIVVTGDLQEPPELIPRMIDLWEQGNDVVYGVLAARNDSNVLITIGAKLFYTLIFAMTPARLPQNATDFRLVSRRVIDAVKNMREPDRYLRGLVHWVGFRQASFVYDRDKRTCGPSTAGLWYSAGWAAIVSFSNLPLRLAAYFGAATMLISIMASIYFVTVHFYPPEWMPIPPTGTTAIIVLVLFAIGLNALFLGVIGEYIGRIYNQGKGRPLYIVDHKLNFD